MRFIRALFAVAVLAVAGCAPQADTGWDPAAAEALEQRATQMLAQLDAGDFVGMIADADSNVVILDYDANNTPVRVDGIAAAREFMGNMAQAAQSQGLKFSSTPVRSDAWAIGSLGYCVTEFDQTIEVGGQVMGPFKFRGTMIARRDGDHWHMTHWHGSFREMPAMPAGEAAAAPAAK